MFKVYWTSQNSPQQQLFESGQMTESLKFMEDLRKNPENSFVTFCSENPNSVGKPGIAETGPDYNWKKRRI